jgi:hypothetical protein
LQGHWDDGLVWDDATVDEPAAGIETLGPPTRPRLQGHWDDGPVWDDAATVPVLRAQAGRPAFEGVLAVFVKRESSCLKWRSINAADPSVWVSELPPEASAEETTNAATAAASANPVIARLVV